MSEQSLRKLRAKIRALDGPECNCDPSLGPCKHTLGADHHHPVSFWAALLAVLFPEQYSDPPPPAAPVCVKSRKARLAVLRNRAADGVGLWHPQDLVQMPEAVEDEIRADPLAETQANGALQYSSRIVDDTYDAPMKHTSRRAA